MSTLKKTPSKKFIQKVRKVVHGDVFKSVAVASVLLNVLFLVTIIVLTNTDSFDRDFYSASRSRYCQNITGVVERAKVLGSEKAAIEEFQIDCVGAKFQPFYNEAIEKFKAHSNQ